MYFVKLIFAIFLAGRSLVEQLSDNSLGRVFLVLTLLLGVSQRTVEPLFKLAVVNKDLVRDRPEVLDQVKDVLSLHLGTIKLSEDVIELLLGDKAILVGVDVTNCQRNVFESVLFNHDIDELGLCKTLALTDGLINAMSMEVSSEAT